MANYTRLTNLEVTGDLKVGALHGIADVGPPEEVASTVDKAAFNALVGVVNDLIEALGGDTSTS